MSVIKTLIDIRNGIGMVDDIDHLATVECVVLVKWLKTNFELVG